MDSFFGIGIPELIVILILSGIILGPQRIRQVAFTFGRVTAQLQRVSRQFMRQLNAELDSLEDGSVRDTMNDVRELQKEVEALRRELSQVPKSIRNEGTDLVKETRETIKPEGKTSTTETDQQEAAGGDTTPLPKAIDVPGDPE